MDRIQTGERWDPGCSVNTVSEGRVMGAFDLDAENVLEVKLILAEANHEFYLFIYFHFIYFFFNL